MKKTKTAKTKKPTMAEQELARCLKMVLDWPLPGGTTVGSYSIPGWMEDQCREALSKISTSGSEK